MAQLLLSYPTSGSATLTLRSANYLRSRGAFEKPETCWGRSLHVVQCCSTTSTSGSSNKHVELLGRVENDRADGGKGSENGEQFEYLVSEFGWKARRLANEDDEMRKVASIQAEAFHTPLLFFDDLFFEFFKVTLLLPLSFHCFYKLRTKYLHFFLQAEVLSGLFYKLRNSPPNR